MPSPTNHRLPDWRPSIGTAVREVRTGAWCEVIAHFDGEGYGRCIVIRRHADDGAVTCVVTESEWMRDRFVVEF